MFISTSIHGAYIENDSEAPSTSASSPSNKPKCEGCRRRKIPCNRLSPCLSCQKSCIDCRPSAFQGLRPPGKSRTHNHYQKVANKTIGRSGFRNVDTLRSIAGRFGVERRQSETYKPSVQGFLIYTTSNPLEKIFVSTEATLDGQHAYQPRESLRQRKESVFQQPISSAPTPKQDCSEVVLPLGFSSSKNEQLAGEGIAKSAFATVNQRKGRPRDIKNLLNHDNNILPTTLQNPLRGSGQNRITHEIWTGGYEGPDNPRNWRTANNQTFCQPESEAQDIRRDRVYQDCGQPGVSSHTPKLASLASTPEQSLSKPTSGQCVAKPLPQLLSIYEKRGLDVQDHHIAPKGSTSKSVEYISTQNMGVSTDGISLQDPIFQSVMNFISNSSKAELNHAAALDESWHGSMATWQNLKS